MIENLEFGHGVKFEFTDSLKNNGTKYLLIFDDSYGEMYNSRAFADIATADIVDSVLVTLSTTCFIKAILAETLSSRTRTFFFSSLTVM